MILKKEIKFLYHDEILDGVCDPPVKSSKYLPQWIQKLDGVRTAKKCVPLVEACSEGYIWKTHCDVLFKITKEGIQAETFQDSINFDSVKMGMPFVSKHNFEQAYPENHTLDEIEKLYGPLPHHTIFKLSNFFVIETPKGYSCRFKNISNLHNLPLQFFEGVVETDKFYSSINFPFRYTGPKEPHTYMLKKGTPVVQIIPFKREKWKSTVGIVNRKKLANAHYFINSRMYNAYRTLIGRGNNGDT